MISIIPFNVINKNGKLIKISSNQKEEIDEGLFRSKDSFFRYLNRAKKKEDIPTTGAVSVGRCKKVISEASKGQKDVVCILPPKELSKVFENVERASEIVKSEIGNKIEIIESKQAFSSQYFVVKEASELADRSQNSEKIVEHLNKIRKKIHLIVAVYKLRFLRKSGRVKKLKKIASYFADFFKLASIITLEEGIPEPVATIPRTKVENRIHAEIEKHVG